MVSVNSLQKNPGFSRRKGPVVLVIMDGVGFGKFADGDAFLQAYTPELNGLMEKCPMSKLKAHGTAVGMPSDDDMGNSEVGHNALGAGRVFEQGFIASRCDRRAGPFISGLIICWFAHNSSSRTNISLMRAICPSDRRNSSLARSVLRL